MCKKSQAFSGILVKKTHVFNFFFTVICIVVFADKKLDKYALFLSRIIMSLPVIFKDENHFVKHLMIIISWGGHECFGQNSHVNHEFTRYRNGTGDIIVCRNDEKFFMIEAKMPKKKQSKFQTIMQENFIKKHLGENYILLDPDDYESKLKAVGLLE